MEGNNLENMFDSYNPFRNEMYYPVTMLLVFQKTINDTDPTLI